MQFQSLSLADAGWQVTVLAYKGHAPVSTVLESPAIDIRYLHDHLHTRFPYFLKGTFRLVNLTCQLFFHLLFRISDWEMVLVQTPPAIPTIPVSLIATRSARLFRRGCKRLIIDWHNLGFTKFAERIKGDSFITRMYRWIETYFGRRADGHLCVSVAMRDFLARDLGIDHVSILYDRPLLSQMQVSSSESREDFITRLFGRDLIDHRSLRLLVSSTSWTDDEDMEMILRAADLADVRISATSDDGGDPKARMVIIITGEGPNRDTFERLRSARSYQHFTILSAWLTVKDYRLLLALSDFGICLHTSSSGIDLPMKLADMMGARLPTLTYNYGPTLLERFQDGGDGHLFLTEMDLATHFCRLLDEDWVSHYARVIVEMDTRPLESWEIGWKKEALPLFENR